MVRTLCCGHSDPGSIPGLNKIYIFCFSFVAYSGHGSEMGIALGS